MPITIRQAGSYPGKVNYGYDGMIAILIKHVSGVKHGLFRNLDSAARDYSDHLGELERKIIQIVDAALQHQLARYSFA